MAGGLDDSFEERVKDAVHESLAERGLDVEVMGLRFRVVLAVLWLPQQLLTPCFSAQGEPMDAGLRAWRRLSQARGHVPQRGTVLGILSPEEIAASWARVRAAYLDVLRDTGKEMLLAESRLKVLEVQRCRRADVQFEKWNRARMASEEQS